MPRATDPSPAVLETAAATGRGRRRVVILGAAGRDFHDFNVVYRDDPDVTVVAFTAAQIPGIAGRRYPAALAGPRYPAGIPIEEEVALEGLCRREGVTDVVFAYSDVTHEHVMRLASRSLALGADFVLLGPGRTMLQARIPVIAISAVRTGCGKSAVARWLGQRLRTRGLRVAVLRHPMPYGDLARQRVQRFTSRRDLEEARCTLEEREEYEPHLAAGNVVFAGVDYRAILGRAEAEADVIVWDGGNNDFPLVAPDLHVVLVDALRPDHATGYYPGEAVLRTADVVVLSKTDAATPEDIARAEGAARRAAPGATIVRGASPVCLDAPDAVRGRRVLIVEDGPTITHGGMAHGAGFVAACAAGASAIVDPRASAPPSIAAVYAAYPHIGDVLPAVGYDEAQRSALREAIDGSAAEVVVSATPIDLAAVLSPHTPVVRVRYEYADTSDPQLAVVVDAFIGQRLLRRTARDPGAPHDSGGVQGNALSRILDA
jgi:predicted GTPase